MVHALARVLVIWSHSFRPLGYPAFRLDRFRRCLLAYVTAVTCALSTGAAWPAYFTSSLGSPLAGPSDCDDCFEQVSFSAGQTINYFGQIYDSLFVGSNGYVTFGSGLSEYTPLELTSRAAPPMIAAVWTDLFSVTDADANVFVNTSTPGQIVVTWDDITHFIDNSVRTFAQLVIRSNQFAIPAGQGQIGFFYGAITDPNPAVAGFSNGNPTVDDGDLQFYEGPASGLSGRELWMTAPVVSVLPAVPESSTAGALAIGLLLVGLARARWRLLSRA